MLFRDGYLTEASASNVLIVKDGVIIAPPKDNLILPGITYDATFELARDGGLALAVRPVTRDEALGADEMWLSSSTQGSAGGHHARRQAVRRRQTRTRLPQDARAVPGEQAQGDIAVSATASRMRAAQAIAAAVPDQRGNAWCAQASTSPMNSMWSPAGCSA